MQSAQHRVLDRLPSVLASTTPYCGDTGVDIVLQPSRKLGATLPIPTQWSNLSTAALTSPDSPLLHVDIGQPHTSVIWWSQDNIPATLSQEIGRSHPTPPSDSTSLAPEMRASKEKHCSQYQDEEG